MVSTQFVRTADGHIYAWGNNEHGKANPDSQEPFILSPELLTLPEPMVEVKPSSVFTCGRGRSGRVWCWGAPILMGQPAGGYFLMPGVESAQTLMVSGEGHCILDAFRRGICWSNNELAELSTGSGQRVLLPPLAPVEMWRVEANVVTLLPSVAAIQGGQILTWGSPHTLGVPPPETTVPIVDPQAIPGLLDPVRVEGGKLGYCATLRSGQVHCWGQQILGENTFVPFLAFEHGPYKKVAVSLDLCALRSDGQVECHGAFDQNAELGGVRDISGGIFDLCLLMDDGHILCKGDNSEGQLGNGTKGNDSKELVPVAIPPIE
jgi:hypothetical protein